MLPELRNLSNLLHTRNNILGPREEPVRSSHCSSICFVWRNDKYTRHCPRAPDVYQIEMTADIKESDVYREHIQL